MIAWFKTAFSTYVLHTLHGNGYQWWSGPGGKSLGIAAIFGALAHHRRRS